MCHIAICIAVIVLLLLNALGFYYSQKDSMSNTEDNLRKFYIGVNIILAIVMIVWLIIDRMGKTKTRIDSTMWW
jgi:putative copper export protein